MTISEARAASVEGNHDHLATQRVLGLVATAGLFLAIGALVTWRQWIAGLDETRTQGIVVVAIAAAIATNWVFSRAWQSQGRVRLAWATIGAGLVIWVGGALLFARVADQVTLSGRFVPIHVGWAALATSLCSGILLLGRPRISKRAHRKLILDLTPTVIALAVIVWLAVFGSNAIAPDASWRLRSATIVHGVGALFLLVVAFAGAFRPSRFSDPAVSRLLSLSAALFAVSNLTWLHPWIGGRSDQSLVAQVGFLAAFYALTMAVLQASINDGASAEVATVDEDEPFATDRLQFVPFLSLLALLSLAWLQIRLGDLQPFGTELALLGSLAVVVFVMIRQAFTNRQARVLKGEIGNLTEQIDGLIQQVGRDPLTGLLNRRAVLARIDHELVHGRTFGHPLAIVLIDVDNFKKVNDTLGHQAGDRVLLAVGSILSAACRGTDVAARYAGDEFLLVLPGLNEPHAAHVCDRIVDDVRRLAEELHLDGIRVSLSVGAAVTHQCKRGPAQVIEIADAAMYDAKEGGKDRVVVVDADTLMQPGRQPLGDQARETDLTYLPSPAVRALDDRRAFSATDRAS